MAVNSLGHIFVTEDGLDRSTDNGATWVRSFNVPWPHGGVTYVAVDSQDRVWVATSSGIWRSADNADTFTFIGPPGDIDIRAIAFTPQGHVYAGGYGSGGVWRSLDDGTSWTKLSAFEPDYSVNYITTGSGGIWVGGWDLRRSLDSGNTWAKVFGCGTGPIAINADGRVFADSCGIVRSTADNGTTWTEHPDSNGPTNALSLVFDTDGYLYKGMWGGSVWRSVDTTLAVKTVPIDIKPGAYPNTIKLGSNGAVPVAILSTPDFDATTVDPLSVTLADAAVRLKGKGTPMASQQDVNGDGRLDLLVHVSTDAMRLSATDTIAVLQGKTYSGRLIKGQDSVRVVP